MYDDMTRTHNPAPVGVQFLNHRMHPLETVVQAAALFFHLQSTRAVERDFDPRVHLVDFVNVGVGLRHFFELCAVVCFRRYLKPLGSPDMQLQQLQQGDKVTEKLYHRSVHVDPIGGLLFVWLLELPAVLARRPFLLFGSGERLSCFQGSICALHLLAPVQHLVGHPYVDWYPSDYCRLRQRGFHRRVPALVPPYALFLKTNSLNPMIW